MLERMSGASQSLVIYGVFLRLFGVVYLVQFTSTFTQIVPLLGRRGIEPASVLLRAARRDLPLHLRIMRFPTLFWFGDTDNWLRGVCLAGILVSVAIIAGVAGPYSTVLFLLAWICWLSIQTVGSTVFSLPWDKLLSEASFLVLFMPGLRLLPDLGVVEPPMPVAVLAFRWLLFRVMFGMGLAKFRSPDRETRDGTFLLRYYDRQPMPTVLAFYVRALPLWFHKLCLVAFFLSELVIPFFAFGPLWMRWTAGVSIMGLQVVILATGNYGIFNALTLVLAVPLLAGDFSYADILTPRTVGQWIASSLLAVHTVLALPYAFLLDSWSGGSWLYSRKGLSSHQIFRHLAPVTTLLRWLAPFHLLNAYGIFVSGVFRRRRMVTVLQGSVDGETWLDYEPKFLPCSPSTRPRRFAPHHPRFDHYFYYERGLPYYRTFTWLWQTNPYYLHSHSFKEKLVQKLLCADPHAQLLFKNNPFPNEPPTSIRYSSWAYEFTTPAEKARTGNWWRRELIGLSESIRRDDSLDEFAGVQRAYLPFLADSVCYLASGAVAYTDPDTGRPIPIQSYPIRLVDSMPS